MTWSDFFDYLGGVGNRMQGGNAPLFPHRQAQAVAAQKQADEDAKLANIQSEIDARDTESQVRLAGQSDQSTKDYLQARLKGEISPVPGGEGPSAPPSYAEFPWSSGSTPAPAVKVTPGSGPDPNVDYNVYQLLTQPGKPQPIPVDLTQRHISPQMGFASPNTPMFYANTPEEQARQLSAANSQAANIKRQSELDSMRKDLQAYKVAHPQFAQDNEDELNQIELRAITGWTPPEGKGKSQNWMDDLLERATGGDQAAAELYAKAQKIKEPSGLSNETADWLADQAHMTGQIPAMGMGRNATIDREKVFAAWRQKYPNDNVGQIQATFRANQLSAARTIQQYDNLMPFERTAQATLDQVLARMKDVADSGSPFLNEPLRIAKSKFMGDDKLAALNAAVNPAMTEVARIIQSPGLTGQLHQESIKAAQALVDSKSATYGQAYAAIKQLRQEMLRRKTELETQIGNIDTRFGSPDSLRRLATEQGSPVDVSQLPEVVNNRSNSPSGATSDGKVHLIWNGHRRDYDPKTQKNLIDQAIAGGAKAVP